MMNLAEVKRSLVLLRASFLGALSAGWRKENGNDGHRFRRAGADDLAAWLRQVPLKTAAEPTDIV
jgi:hypothetical protein